MKYDDVYMKVGHDQAMWYVKDGCRRLLESQNDLWELGMKKLVRVTQDELDAIPVEGQKRGKRGTRGDADESEDASSVEGDSAEDIREPDVSDEG